ncbi:tripartite ATP-independent transporter solute receptor, DctP family [Anaerovirgula multivorans]|uniref:Tripartite ATP-independent transporter solute receptor, DctP family n=1 Tax=Anaerovirgula multivorans TaxID=312168 RepID=A0A239ETK7_9FIRM|nr:TRAP transporter substrate-binding protein [Anaerovirgula multivorans]SNS47929.1 tripartite ATP-independent transporter solute receptor, DctP family [Anaerovirgula multivorans]
MFKKIMSILIVGIMLISFVGCSKTNDTSTDAGTDVDVDTPAAVTTQVLKLSFNQSENHPQYKALETFGKHLEEETGGAYAIEISPNALLGDQRASSELVQSGAIQMAVVGNPIVENFNKDFAVIGLPYIYDSLEHQKEVFTSGILNELFASVSGNGFEVVGAFTAGSRNVYADKAIEKPADLSGYKIRVMESDTMKKMLDYMGGIGTPMAQGEVYTAVQQGVLEGGENNEVTYVDLKHYEIAPYFSYTQHLMVPDLIIINNNIYAGMSNENKEIFNRLMNETIENQFAGWNDSVEDAKKVAIENGATFVELDIRPFQENVTPLHNEVTASSEKTKKLYDEIRTLAQ